MVGAREDGAPVSFFDGALVGYLRDDMRNMVRARVWTEINYGALATMEAMPTVAGYVLWRA